MCENNGIDAPTLTFPGTITDNLGLFRTLVRSWFNSVKFRENPSTTVSLAGVNSYMPSDRLIVSI